MSDDQFTYGEPPPSYEPGRRGAPTKHIDFYNAVVSAAGEWVSTAVDTRSKANSVQQNTRKHFKKRGITVEAASRKDPLGGFRVYARTTA